MLEGWKRLECWDLKEEEKTVRGSAPIWGEEKYLLEINIGWHTYYRKTRHPVASTLIQSKKFSNFISIDFGIQTRHYSLHNPTIIQFLYYHPKHISCNKISAAFLPFPNRSSIVNQRADEATEQGYAYAHDRNFFRFFLCEEAMAAVAENAIGSENQFIQRKALASDSESEYQKDVSKLVDLLSKLNPSAKEFFPS